MSHGDEPWRLSFDYDDAEKAEYEARREATLDYNLRSLRRAANVEKIRQ